LYFALLLTIVVEQDVNRIKHVIGIYKNLSILICNICSFIYNKLN